MRVGLFCYFQNKMKGYSSFNQFELCCWLSMLLLLSEDVHENPGTSTSSMDTFVPAQGNLSLVNYNVQIILNKKDILFRDLRNYDILSFTETWLNSNIVGFAVSLFSYPL